MFHKYRFRSIVIVIKHVFAIVILFKNMSSIVDTQVFSN